MAAIQGGNFWNGAAAGALSSIASSAFGWDGNTMDDTTLGWANSVRSSGAGMIAFGTVAGGVGASLSGGNFWQGAATGLVVSGLNHSLHSSKTKINSNSNDELTPEGEVTFKGLTEEQLKDFILIPGDAKEGQILKATPVANDEVYKVDGVYPKNFTEKKYWFKVANGNSATISFSNKTGKYSFDTTTSYINPLRYVGFVGFLSKIEDHGKKGLGNPFDRNR